MNSARGGWRCRVCVHNVPVVELEAETDAFVITDDVPAIRQRASHYVFTAALWRQKTVVFMA